MLPLSSPVTGNDGLNSHAIATSDTLEEHLFTSSHTVNLVPAPISTPPQVPDLPVTPKQTQVQTQTQSSQPDSPQSSEALLPTSIAGHPIKYEYEDLPGGHRLLRFLPTPAQWDEFPSIFSLAQSLGAAADGCFKMILPQEMRHPLPARPRQTFPANAYKARQVRNRKNLFWQVSTVPSTGVFSSHEAEADCSATPEAAVRSLKTLYHKNKDKQIRKVRYRVDVPAWTPDQRREAGVPERSPLHPLKGDQLDHTQAIIPGIHVPYVYESGPYFGASFQLHAEDFRLTSLNHLYKGRKIWIVVPATAVDIAEEALNRRGKCSQFMRHRAEFFFPDRFDKMGIPYRIIDQRPDETMVILPDAYHEGFSTGYTIAEAKNYADATWDPENYQPCQPSCKLLTAIPAAFMRPLGEGEDEARINLCPGYGDQAATAPLTSPPAMPTLSTPPSLPLPSCLSTPLSSCGSSLSFFTPTHSPQSTPSLKRTIGHDAEMGKSPPSPSCSSSPLSSYHSSLSFFTPTHSPKSTPSLKRTIDHDAEMGEQRVAKQIKVN